MTVIAYRNGTMASDSMVSAERTISGTRQKVFKTKGGILVGAAGELQCVSEFLKFVLPSDAIKRVEDIPFDAIIGKGDITAILVGPDKRIWFYEGGLSAFTIETDYATVGSGYEVATGALEAGLSAEEAVEVTCRVVNSCGGPIQKVKL